MKIIDNCNRLQFFKEINVFQEQNFSILLNDFPSSLSWEIIENRTHENNR